MGNNFVTGLFYGRERKDSDVNRFDYNIRVKQIYLGGLASIMFLISAAAVCVSLVPGAGTGGPVVTFSSMPRVVWLVAPLIVSALTLFAPYFTSDGDTSLTVSWCRVFFWVNLVDAAALIVLCVSAILELTEETSTFFLQNNGAWVWAFAIGSGFVALWTFWIMWRLWVYWHDLLAASARGWHPGIAHTLGGAAKDEAMESQPLNPTPPASVPEQTDLKNNIGASISYNGGGVFQPQKFSVSGVPAVAPLNFMGSVVGKKNL